MNNYTIFSDLDGTLLNHHTYAYEAVLPLLTQLADRNIPVILNSSKTLSELEVWKQRLSLKTPMIAENGGVIRYDDGETMHTKLIGKPYSEIRSFIKHLRKFNGWQFEGFGDWTVAEVMNHTQLKINDAVHAKEREVSEPILWNDSEESLARFKNALSAEGLTLKKGGRFYHVMALHDKADAMQFLEGNKAFGCGQACTTIALGDGGNDLAMLEYADIAVVMPPANGAPLQVESAIYSKLEAPQGWVESIESILKLR
ncbi:MAG: HAD-IIB family hydrolase [Pseudomonadota bacterium]|nr:HAD-IIB family hydrolase [Pseudomonadota bacterium]